MTTLNSEARRRFGALVLVAIGMLLACGSVLGADPFCDILEIKMDTLDSSIAIVGTTLVATRNSVAALEAKLDDLASTDSALAAIEEKLDTTGSQTLTELNRLVALTATLEAKLDDQAFVPLMTRVIDAKVDALEMKLDLLEPETMAELARLDAATAAIEMKLDLLRSVDQAVSTIEEKLDTLGPQTMAGLVQLERATAAIETKLDSLAGTSTAVAAVERKLDVLGPETLDGLDELGQATAAIETKLDTGVQTVTVRLDAVEAKLDQVGIQEGQTNRALAALEAKVDALASSQAALGAKLDWLIAHTPQNMQAPGQLKN